MSEYIYKQKMLKYLEENNAADEWIVGQYNADWIYGFIESQPTADVEEVKHGEWVHSSRGFDVSGDYECSVCQSPSGIKHFYNGKKYSFCPDCGAKMDGKENETP